MTMLIGIHFPNVVFIALRAADQNNKVKKKEEKKSESLKNFYTHNHSSVLRL